MGMGIDQSRNRRDALASNGVVSGLRQTIADGLNNTPLMKDRIRCRSGLSKLSP